MTAFFAPARAPPLVAFRSLSRPVVVTSQEDKGIRRILVPLSNRTQGPFEINGTPLEAGRSRGFGELGVAPQDLAIWATLTSREQLELVARLYEPPRGEARQREKQMLEDVFAGLCRCRA